MSTRFSLEQTFITTLEKVLDFIGIKREIVICDEDNRIYVQDGKTKGGFPVAMSSDPTLEIRGIPFKGPDPKAGEIWIKGEWPSDENEEIKKPAYIAGIYEAGAFSLKDNGTLVNDSANVLNFTDGLYVSPSGDISTVIPASLDWTVDISDENSTPIITKPESLTTHGWSGSSGSGFSSIPAASFATVIQQGMYLEFNIPTKNSDIGFIQFRAAAPSAKGFFEAVEEDYMSISWQGGVISSLPDNGSEILNCDPLNQQLETDNYIFGLEFTQDGIYHHSNGIRKKIRINIDKPLSLNASVFSQDDSLRTIEINPNPVLPSSVGNNVTSLQDSETKKHPLDVFDSNAIKIPDEITEEELIDGINTNVRLISPLDLKKASEIHARPLVSGKPYSTSEKIYKRAKEINFSNVMNQDYGFQLSSVGDVITISIRGPAFFDPSRLVSSSEFNDAVCSYINERSGGIHVDGSGSFSGTLPSFLTFINRIAIGTIKIQMNYGQAIGNFIFNAQVVNGDSGDSVKIVHAGESVFFEITDSSGSSVNRDLYIIWQRRSDLS